MVSIPKRLYRLIHLSPALPHILGLCLLILMAIALGWGVSRVFRTLARKHRNTWKDLLFSLLGSLSLPLLILVAIDTGLQVLTLPQAYERIGRELITALTVLVVYLFPAKAISLFLRRLGDSKPKHKELIGAVVVLVRSLFVLVALYTLLEILSLPRHYQRLGSKLVAVIAIALVFYVLTKIAVLYLARLSQRDPGLRRVSEPAVFATRLVFATLAIIVILDNLGVHLTAIWTTLGVGSVGVALAMQETLSNFFAGLYLLAERPISPGNYIKLDTGHEGYVVQVGWRSTTIRTLPNNIVVVPNSLMAKSVITNFSLPEPRMALLISIGVSYGSNPAHVEKVLIEVAREAARDGIPGLLSDPSPAVRFMPGFGDSSLNFTLIVHVREFVDQFVVQHELRKRILECFRRENISIPFPTRTISFDQAALAALHKTEPQVKS